MTPKQRLFADTYLANGFKVKPAYWDVYGHRENKKVTQAYEILQNPEVAAYIKEKREEIYHTLNIDAMRVMSELAELAFEPTDEKNKSSKLKALDIMSKNLNLQNTKVEAPDTIEVCLINDNKKEEVTDNVQ